MEQRRKRMFSSPEKAATNLGSGAGVGTPVAPGGWGWTPGGKKKGLGMGGRREGEREASGSGSGKGKEREREQEPVVEVKRVVQQSEEETVWRVRRGGRASAALRDEKR